MKFILVLLLAFALTASAYASAGQLRSCCSGEDCSVIQCTEMGCLPAAVPAVADALAALPDWEREDNSPAECSFYLPNRYKDIWTPPD